MTALYGNEEVDIDSLELLFKAQRLTFARQIDRLKRVGAARGNCLEIGSYVGAFLDAAHTAGRQFEGVDVNSAAVAFARGKGFTVHHGTIADVSAENRYDVVSFWNFSLPVISAGAPLWAGVEGRATHAFVRSMRRLTGAPWIEMYARKTG